MSETFESEMQKSGEGITTSEIIAEERKALDSLKNEAEASGYTELAMTAQLAEIITEAARCAAHPEEGIDQPTPEEVAERFADTEKMFGKAA